MELACMSAYGYLQRVLATGSGGNRPPPQPV